MTKYVFASIGEVILCDVRSYYKFMMMTLVNKILIISIGSHITSNLHISESGQIKFNLI